MNRWLKLSLLLCMVMGLTSCHWLHNYNRELERYPEIEDLSEEGIEVAVYSEEEQIARAERLAAINSEPYPPYLIDTGDQLRLTVYNHEDLNDTLTVTPDGFVVIPFVGQVHVQGKTIPKVIKAIDEGLAPYLKNYAIGIAPVQMPSQLATIGGTITKPGMYPVRAGIRLSDIFALGGSGRTQLFNGQTLDMADFQNSLFIRKGEVLPVDFEQAIIYGNLANNIEVHKGDYIYIASRTDAMVSVVGAVARPSYLTWNPRMRLTDAITNTGGLAETYWRYAIIIRQDTSGNSKFYRINIDEVLAGLKTNPRLVTGDIVYVPMDALSYYNVFIRKLLPTGQLYNMGVSPVTTWDALRD